MQQIGLGGDTLLVELNRLLQRASEKQMNSIFPKAWHSSRKKMEEGNTKKRNEKGEIRKCIEDFA
jgi:hypothetical protein